MTTKVISKIVFNWFVSSDGEDSKIAQVGVGGVKEIIYHTTDDLPF